MIESIDIQNYKNIESLSIKGLKRINLFAGENNIGKTTLLEAIGIICSGGSLKVFEEILNMRGEIPNFVYRDGIGINQQITTEQNITIFASLFKDRKIDNIAMSKILISAKGNDIQKGNADNAVKVSFELNEEPVIQLGKHPSHQNKSKKESTAKNRISEAPISITINENAFSLSDGSIFGRLNARLPSQRKSNLQFIWSGGIDKENNANLWDEISATDEEVYVIDALKIIEADIERLTFIQVQENSPFRTPEVKLKGQNRVPLRGMGDGINRILTIILSMVNARNGYLLIDEFENGLHYKVQHSVWKLISELAERLNVQVFATTHSTDCIRAFGEVIDEKGKPENGTFIRLAKKDGKIGMVDFDADEIKVSIDQKIELR